MLRPSRAPKLDTPDESRDQSVDESHMSNIDKAQTRHLMHLENRVRVLEGKRPLSPARFRAAMRARMD